MKILIYNDLAPGKLKKELDNMLKYLQFGDFKTIALKKSPNTEYFNLKLDDTNRLLFKIGTVGLT